MKLKVNHNLDVEFEKTYKDRITGYEGVCIATAKYVSGCDQVLLQPKVKEGNYEEGRWFDDERLIDIEAEKPIKRSSIKGGPQQNEAPIR